MRPLLLALLAVSLCSAVLVEGEIISANTFDLVQDAVVKLSGPTTVQQVAENGTFSFDVPQGDYELSAYQYSGGAVSLFAKEPLRVGAEKIWFVAVLFPPSEFEEELLPLMEEPELVEVPEPQDSLLLYIVISLLLVIIALLAFLFLRSGKPKEYPKGPFPGAEEIQKPPALELDGEEKRVLQVLGESEGMRTQKELREILNCTDAKMSLLLSSLEARGLVKRIKRGRENIVKLR